MAYKGDCRKCGTKNTAIEAFTCVCFDCFSSKKEDISPSGFFLKMNSKTKDLKKKLK